MQFSKWQLTIVEAICKYSVAISIISFPSKTNNFMPNCCQSCRVCEEIFSNFCLFHPDHEMSVKYWPSFYFLKWCYEVYGC